MGCLRTIAGRRTALADVGLLRREHPIVDLPAGAHAELGEHVLDVYPNRARADPQHGGNLTVRVPLPEQPRDLVFPRRERLGRGGLLVVGTSHRRQRNS